MLRTSRFLVFLLVVFFASLVSPCRRRRRSPDPVPCRVSGWKSWSACSKYCDIGTRSRTRSVITWPAHGGSRCPSLIETKNCGSRNGSCEDTCLESNRTCVCTTPGYELKGETKCVDINECRPNGTAECINSECRNTNGSYACDCFTGYRPTSDFRRCDLKLCSPLTAPQCPGDGYSDAFGEACMQSTISCPEGYGYQKSCTLNCTNNYKLAVIAPPNYGKRFAQDFNKADFNSPSDRTVCKLNPHSGAVFWDWNSVTTPYYCRRVNDPPSGVNITKTSINEKQSPLTPVGQLSATDPQGDRITFSISNSAGDRYFLIQGNMLLVKTRLVWNPDLRNNSYSVVVKASDNGSPTMYSQVTLNIVVVNINDPPHDLELSNNDIFEDVPINYIVGNLTALDDDVSLRRTSNFAWNLVDDGNGFFFLSGNKILVARKLDHESTNFHRIQVKCTDYGSPRKSSQVQSILINVHDANESPKHINLTNYRVAENSLVGTVVGTVTATDEDNDTLSFDLQGSDSTVLAKFEFEDSGTCAVLPDNGRLIQTCSATLVVKGSLDYEMKNEYIIWVGVTDSAGVAHKQFRIEIENVNEGPTDILLSDNIVPENSPGGTVVGEFLVEDPDNANEMIQSHTCSLVSSLNGDEHVFYIAQENQRNLLRIKANVIFDFETKKVYNFTVFCKDTDDLGISKLLQIQVTDVNEPPTSLSLSSTTVRESNLDMIYIGTLSAEDPEGLNQKFTYSVPRDSQSFRIGGTNKDELFYLGPLDFEHTPSISVHLRVTDDGGLHLEKIFTITVQDVNDAPTDIRLQPADAQLLEESLEYFFISQIEMIDQDSNTRASCQLLNSSNDRVRLNSMVLLVGPTMTDYESLDSTKSLQILIKCQDQHGASITRWINLPVKDVNEAPTLLTLSNLEMEENKNDVVVGILGITDPDIGQRHACTINGSDTPFYIDNSGNPPKLKTVRPLDFESSRVESVTIVCKDIVLDSSQAPNSIEKEFKIYVIDVNEEPQILCNTLFYVSPSFSRDAVLGQIHSYDPDNELPRNPNASFEQPKQRLNIRFENESIFWPFYISKNHILYLKKQPTSDEYNKTITFRIRVEDDGTVLERKKGSEEYQMKNVNTKHSVHSCSVFFGSNEKEIDFSLSSNTIPEDATYGTKIIGNLSRTPLQADEQISYDIIEITNKSRVFEIDGNTLKVQLDATLDYEQLPEDKSLPITISSVASISGVFTKQFLIKVLDENEMPTAVCLTSPLPNEKCSVVGHFLIEDLDYPELKCGKSKTADLEKFSRQLAEYICYIREGVETSSNKVFVNEYFYIENSPPVLYVKKTIFARGGKSYSVPVVCLSKEFPLHVLRPELNVTITVPDDPNCRRDELCASCRPRQFCLSHVAAPTKRCVGEDYRINSTVPIPVSLFGKPGFISMFENYVTSLIEGTLQGKTLTQLVQEFNGNDASRRRREAQYSSVYVEELVHDGKGTSTNVVFAVAEKPNYNLIPASAACKLLKNTDVKCFKVRSTPRSPTSGTNGGIPFHLIIGISVAGLVVLAFIIAVVVVRRRNAKKKEANRGRVESNGMYEIPVIDHEAQSSHSGPFVLEKRAKPLKVNDHPAFANQGFDKDCRRDEPTTSRHSRVNHYSQHPSYYETIDGDLRARVHSEMSQFEFGSKEHSTWE